MAVFIHAAVFAVLLYFKSYIPILGSLEGFQDPPANTPAPPPMNPPPSMNTSSATTASSMNAPPPLTAPVGSSMGRISNTSSTAKKIAMSTATAAAQAYDAALQANDGKYEEMLLGHARKVMVAAADAAK